MKFLTAAAALVALPCFAATTHFRPEISYLDGCETIETNPARGKAGGGWVTFKPEGLPNWHGQSGYHSSLWELSRFSGGREERGKRPTPERVGEADIPLTEEMKSDVRRFLDETRAKGGTLIVRLGYTWSEQPGCEPADFDILLGHVAELSQIMSAYPDIIAGVEAGVAGPWGEMHTSEYCKPEYMNRILKTYIDNIGETIPILVRSPCYFNYLAGKDTEGLLASIPFKDKYLKRLGMYNDGYIGTWWDYGTWAGDFTRERGCVLLKSIGRAPYGGEIAHVDRAWLDNNSEKIMDLFNIERWNIVKDWYEVHINYLRNISQKGHTIAEFLDKDIRFESAKYKFDGMPGLSEYDGTTMGKFLLDHLGYRYVIRDARLPKAIVKEREARIALDIENTGFGRLLLPAKVEVIVNGKTLPAKCDIDIPGGARKRVAVSFKAEESASAPYDICIVVKVGSSRVRFANKGMWDESLGANRLAASVVAPRFDGREHDILDLDGEVITTDEISQKEWNGLKTVVSNGTLRIRKRYAMRGGDTVLGPGATLAVERGGYVATGSGDARCRDISLAEGSSLRFEGVDWDMDHTRLCVSARSEFYGDIERHKLKGGGYAKSRWEIAGKAMLPRGINLKGADNGARLDVVLKDGGVMCLGGPVAVEGKNGNLSVVLEGGRVCLFWDAKFAPGIVKVAPGATVVVEVVKGAVFDVKSVEVPDTAHLIVKKVNNFYFEIPARYSFSTYIDANNRSYYISADHFKESIKTLTFEYPNPDCESPRKTVTERAHDSLFRKRFPSGKGPWTVTAALEDIHGDTYTTNIIVAKLENPKPQLAPNELVLVGHTEYGDSHNLSKGIYSERLCNLHVGWSTAGKLHPDSWPQESRAEWMKVSEEEKMWYMTIYSGPDEKIQKKLIDTFGGRYIGNNIGEYASYLYQGDECRPKSIPNDRNLLESRDYFVNRYAHAVPTGWQGRFPYSLSTCGAALSCYELAGGIDCICNEQWAIGAQNLAHTSAEARGAARKWGPEYWCAWNAHEWQTCPIPYHTNQKYDSCLVGYLQEYIFGTSMIVLESGAQGTQAWKYTASFPGQPESERKAEGYDEEVARRYREVTKKFYDWVKANPRDKGTPETKIAMALGNLDSYLGLNSGFTVWAQHANAATNKLWKYGPPEWTQALAQDMFFPRSQEVLKPYGNLWLAGTPFGQVDVFNVDDETRLSDLRRYDLLVFGGWNTMMPLEKEVLERYVTEGGTLVMSRPELTTRIDRDYVGYTDKDLMPLFGFLPPEGKSGEYVEKKFGKGRYFLFTARTFPAADEDGKKAYTALVSRLAREVRQSATIEGDAETLKCVTYAVYPSKIYVLNMDTLNERAFTLVTDSRRCEMKLAPCEIVTLSR